MVKEQITIEKHLVKRIPIKIRGVSDLLMHGKTPQWTEKYEKDRDKKKAEKTFPKPEEEANLGLWATATGQPMIPSGNIYRMLRDSFGALTDFASGYKKIYDTSIQINPDEILLKFATKEIDKRTVNIGRQTPDIRCRWRFANWEIEFEILLRSTSAFDEKRLATILNFAGKFVGLMDGRTMGFGRFEIVNQ